MKCAPRMLASRRSAASDTVSASLSSCPGCRTQSASISEPSRCPERNARRRIRCERGSGVTSTRIRSATACWLSGSSTRGRPARLDVLGELAQRRARAARRGSRAGRSSSSAASTRVGRVDLAVPEPLLERLRRQVDEHDLVGLVEDPVGERLADADARELEDLVVEALEVLDVDGRGDVDPGVEDLVDVLVALAVPRLGQVRVRELVDERELRARGGSRRRRPSPAARRRRRVLRRCGTASRPVGERRRLGPVVRLEVADHDVDALVAAPAGPPGASGRSCRLRRPSRAGSGSGRARASSLRAEDVVDEQVDQLDPDERQDHPAEPVDQQVAAQQRRGADRAVLDALAARAGRGPG